MSGEDKLLEYLPLYWKPKSGRALILIIDMSEHLNYEDLKQAEEYLRECRKRRFESGNTQSNSGGE